MKLAVHDQGSTPREVGWIYDFYKFWKDNMIFFPNNEADMYKFFHLILPIIKIGV